MKKLYTVTIEVEIVVAADSEERAEDILVHEDVFRDMCIDDWTVSAHRLDYAPAGWEDHSIPWGGDDDTPLGRYTEWQAMKANAAARSAALKEAMKDA